MQKLIDWLQAQSPARLVVGLGGAAFVLLLIGIVGALNTGGSGHKTSASGGNHNVAAGITGEDTGTTVAGAPGETTTTVAGGAATTTPGSKPGTSSGTKTTAPGGGVFTPPPTPGHDTTGVTPTEIKWGLHAPKTLDGAPLALAADPLEGVDIYQAQLGDFSGRKIHYYFADDRYTVDGGKTAAKALIDDAKVFMAEGTLGVDQIAQVAAEARKRNTPYMAAGGSEAIFKDIGMFQISASYDTMLSKLADYLGKQRLDPASPYHNLTKVGVSSLDSPYINGSGGSVDTFRTALQKNGLQLVKVVTVQKPTEQTSYGTQIQDLKNAGTQIFVPTQDPVTTSREVAECKQQLCQWQYAFANFAHDEDVALTLMAGSWSGATPPVKAVRGLSAGCYYLPKEGKNPYDPAKCAQVKTAHEIWAQAKGEDDWVNHGQGGVAGYQVVHFWLGALRSLGADVSRERFVAALRAYNGYNDLVTGPISFAGSPNVSHGVTKVAVYEGTSQANTATHNLTYHQLSDGLVDGF